MISTPETSRKSISRPSSSSGNKKGEGRESFTRPSSSKGRDSVTSTPESTGKKSPSRPSSSGGNLKSDSRDSIILSKSRQPSLKQVTIDETKETIITQEAFDSPKEKLPSNNKKDEIQIIIRPICQDWQMGEDWEISFPFLKNFTDLKEYIEKERGISQHRIQIKLKGKILTYTREKWTLRRMGIYDGYVIQIEPTLPESWWWNPYDYYVEQYLQQIEKVIEESEKKGIYLTELEKLVVKPLPIKPSLKVFLRTYPDRIHLYCNTSENTYWVTRTKELIQIPTFSSVPHDLGYFPIARLPDFDWDSYKDIDDKYRVEMIEIKEEDFTTDSRYLKKEAKSFRKSDLQYLLGEKDVEEEDEDEEDEDEDEEGRDEDEEEEEKEGVEDEKEREQDEPGEIKLIDRGMNKNDSDQKLEIENGSNEKKDNVIEEEKEKEKDLENIPPVG